MDTVLLCRLLHRIRSLIARLDSLLAYPSTLPPLQMASAVFRLLQRVYIHFHTQEDNLVYKPYRPCIPINSSQHQGAIQPPTRESSESPQSKG